MGIAYTPTWVEFPMFHAGNPLPLQVGHAVFLHMIPMDSDAALAMTMGRSLIVGETGAERLPRHDTGLVSL